MSDTATLTALYEAETARFEKGEGNFEPEARYHEDADGVLIEVIDADGNEHPNLSLDDEMADAGWAADAYRVAARY